MRALRATAERAQTGCHPEKTAFSGMLLIGISSFQSENAPAVFRPCKRAGRLGFVRDRAAVAASARAAKTGNEAAVPGQ